MLSDVQNTINHFLNHNKRLALLIACGIYCCKINLTQKNFKNHCFPI